MARRTHNWTELRAAYARDRTISLDAFADSQKISRSQVHDHARKENWRGERERVQSSVAEQVTKAVIKEEVKAAVVEWRMDREEIDKIQHRASRNALAIAHNALAKIGEARDGEGKLIEPSPGEVERWTGIIEKAADGARKSAHYPIAVQRIEVTGADGMPIVPGVVILPAQTDE